MRMKKLDIKLYKKKYLILEILIYSFISIFSIIMFKYLDPQNIKFAICLVTSIFSILYLYSLIYEYKNPYYYKIRKRDNFIIIYFFKNNNKENIFIIPLDNNLKMNIDNNTIVLFNKNDKHKILTEEICLNNNISNYKVKRIIKFIKTILN